MSKAAIALFAVAVATSTPALAETHYMLCFGGGRPGLYYSNVFPVPAGTIDEIRAKAFNAFVKAKYHAIIYSECHSNGTLATAQSDKKIREDSDQHSRFPSKLIETGWVGK